MFTVAGIQLQLNGTDNQTTRQHLKTELRLIVDCLYKQMSWPSCNLISLPAAGHLEFPHVDVHFSSQSIMCSSREFKAKWVGRTQLLSLPFILSVVVINFFLGSPTLFVSFLPLFTISLTAFLWPFLLYISPLSPLLCKLLPLYLLALFDLLFLSFYALVWCPYYVLSHLRSMLTIAHLSVFDQ